MTKRRDRRRRITTLAVALGLAAAAWTAPAAADPPGPWILDFASLETSINFTQVGVVPGLPGNAHSGGFDSDDTDDALLVELADWRCPPGFAPPLYVIDDTECTLLRDRTGDAFYNSEEWPTPVGLVGAHYRGRLPIYDEFDNEVDAMWVNLVWRPAGPVAVESHRTYTDTTETLDTVATAPMRVSGRVDGLRLGAPHTTFLLRYHYRHTQRHRELSAD